MVTRKKPRRRKPQPAAVMSPPVGTSLWRQAITGSDNRSVDQSWLIVMVAVFVALPFSLVSLVVIAAYDVVKNSKDFVPASLGGGIAAILAGIAAFVGACAAILRQDRAPAAPSTTTTMQASSVTTT